VCYSLILTLTLLCGQSEPAAASPPPLSEKVQKLVAQLDDDDLKVRDSAEAALIALGPPVIDLLPVATEKMSLELKARLARARTALEKAEIETFTKPTQLTLQGEMKLSEAIKKIEETTGNALVDFRERFGQEVVDSVVKLDMENVPFWQGVDQLFDAAELTVYNYSDAETAGKLPFIARTKDDSSRSTGGIYTSLFRLEVQRVDATRHLRKPTSHSLQVFADLVWEPRIRPIVILFPLQDLKAIDDLGNPLQVETEGTHEIPIEGTNSGVETALALALPKRAATKIKSLTGKFTAVIPGRVETFTFGDLANAKNASLERGGAVLTLENARKNEDLEEIRIRLKFDKSANALESHRGWIYNNENYLIDAAGKKIESGGSEARLVETNEVGLSYLFDLEGRKLSEFQFVYKTPAAIYKIPVEFEFKDIELP
jgi:hypothetical protein